MNRRGFALIGALWMIVAIAAASAVLWHRFEGYSLLAQNHAEAVQARLAAEAGAAEIRAVLESLLAASQRLEAEPAAALDPWEHRHATGSSGSIGTANYQVRVRELDALLSLNLVQESDLAEALAATGLSVPLAATIAASAMDWRDSDDLRRGRGAERAWYEEQGTVTSPRNGPFGSVGELRGVRGMTDSAYRSVAALLTTRGDGRVNLNTATAPVIAALPGIGIGAARRIVAARARGRYASVYDALLHLAPGDRAEAEAVLPRLVARTTFTTDRLLVETTGSVDGGRMRHHVAAVLVRQGDRAVRTEVLRGW